jgi:WD40 repeat protein
MSEENKDHELSLDDIFSRLRKEEDKKRAAAVPFKFLDSYTREDRNIFFGRDGETDDLFRKLYSGKLLLVYGKSGTGKSSIVNCGLISRIPQEDIFAINVRCGRRAYENFVSEIKKYSNAATDKPVEILEDIFYEQSKPIALILDQFEEIFILSDEEERDKLAIELNEILQSRLKINLILVIREEYFASLTEFESYIPGLFANRTRIERMRKSSAREAIVNPCQVCNVGIEEGLADVIIDQLTSQSEEMELTWLQILMDRLYRTAADRDPSKPEIKHDDLAKLGRIGNVLSDFLDEQLRLMPDGDMGEAVLKTMISTDGTKKQVSISDIADTLQASGRASDHSTIETILLHFIKVRIVTEKDEQDYYELRHDAIAGRIFERMTALEKELIEVKSFLDNSYKIYQQRKVLLTDNDLNYIAIYESKLFLKNELKDFIRFSRKEVRQTRVRRRNIAIYATIALFVILTGFTLWALNERAKAIRQSTIAEEQKNEAVKANEEAERARERAQEGENKAKENEARAIEQQRIAEEQRRAAVRANVQAEQSRKEALEEKNRAEASEKTAIEAKQDAEDAKNEAVNANNQAQLYLYLFNGKELANKSLIMQEDNTLRALLALSAYDLVTYGNRQFNSGVTPVKYDNEILEALQKANFLFEKDSLASGEIWSVAMKDNKIVFSNTAGKLNVSGLETTDRKKLPALVTESTLNLPTNTLVRSLAFDPGSGKLACGTLDGNVVLFDDISSVTTLSQTIYNHNNNRVNYINFVPEKNWLISTSSDKTIHIWDMESQKTVKELPLNEQIQKFVLIDPEHMIFTGSSGEILCWNLNNPDSYPEVIFRASNRQPIKTLVYNEKFKWLVAASSGEALIFLIMDPGNITSLEPAHFTMKHKAVITHIEFSPDNNWLVTASSDAIMLWNLRDVGSIEVDKFVPIVIENSRQVFSLKFTNDSKYFIYGDNRVLHIYPVDIQDIYTKLKLKMGSKTLSDQEWRYYVKGNLVRPDLR